MGEPNKRNDADAEVEDEDDAEWPTCASGYAIEAFVGRGTFSKVYKAKVITGRYAGRVVALKRTDLSLLGPDSNYDEVRREMSTMRSLPTHPNLISYHIVFTAKKELWLVMPYMDGGSCEVVMRCCYPSGIPSASAVCYILYCTLRALECLHKNEVMHRDLKSGNILLSSKAQVKLADFGVAASLKEGKTRHTFVGTPCWMAPEVLAPAAGAEEEGYTVQADVWSCGIAAVEMLKGNAPYQNYPPLKAMILIYHGEPFRLQHFDNTQDGDPLFIDLVNSCLEKEPSKRPSVEELLYGVKWKGLWARNCEKGERELVELLKALPSEAARFSGDASCETARCAGRGKACVLGDRREPSPSSPDNRTSMHAAASSGVRARLSDNGVGEEDSAPNETALGASVAWDFELRDGDGQSASQGMRRKHSAEAECDDPLAELGDEES